MYDSNKCQVQIYNKQGKLDHCQKRSVSWWGLGPAGLNFCKECEKQYKSTMISSGWKQNERN